VTVDSLARSTAYAGVAAGTVAGLVWGLAFLVPVVIYEWNPVIVTGSRYIAYGTVACVILLIRGRAVLQMAWRHWPTAVLYAIAGNVGYFLLLVIGIHTVGAPVTDMIIGCIPLTLAAVSNYLSPAYPWRRLVLPFGLVLAGLATVNALEIAGSHPYIQTSVGLKLGGLLATFGAVATWTWYGLANTRFLAEHRNVSPAAWSTTVGAATGVVTLASLPLAWATHQITAPPDPALSSVITLAAGATVLGVVVSFGGTWLWNAASRRLTATVAGLLINVETVAGFGYVYAARQELPPPGQLIGFCLILAGVALVVLRLGAGGTVRRPALESVECLTLSRN